MNEWTITNKKDRTIYNFDTDNIQASMYEVKNAQPNENEERKIHFSATTKISGEMIDAYFWAKDAKDAQRQASDILSEKIREYRKLADTILHEIASYM